LQTEQIFPSWSLAFSSYDYFSNMDANSIQRLLMDDFSQARVSAEGKFHRIRRRSEDEKE
jgi:hypothetical protein